MSDGESVEVTTCNFDAYDMCGSRAACDICGSVVSGNDAVAGAGMSVNRSGSSSVAACGCGGGAGDDMY